MTGNECLNCIVGLLQFDPYFNPSRAILLAVADPKWTDFFPIISAAMDSEPRPGHKVDPFESQAGPNVIQADALDRAAGDQRLHPTRVHLELVPAIQRHLGRRQAGTHFALVIDKTD